MGGAILSKSLIQFSVDGRDCVPSLLFDLRPNYGGGNEDNGNLLQNVPCTHCYTQCPRPCRRPPPTHASARDSWTLMGMSGSVSYGVTAPLSCVPVHTRFCLCPPRVCFPESENEVTQSCLTLSNPMDGSLPGSAVHGIFQARILEWAAISFSRGSSQPRDQTWVSCIADRRFTI